MRTKDVSRGSSVVRSHSPAVSSFPFLMPSPEYAFKMLPTALVILAVSLGRVLGDEKACYAPDGVTLANNETYVPCNKLGITFEGAHSSCCRLDGDPDERQTCALNGLCKKGNDQYRGYCTDQSWNDDACVKVCMDESVSTGHPINSCY